MKSHVFYVFVTKKHWLLPGYSKNSSYFLLVLYESKRSNFLLSGFPRKMGFFFDSKKTIFYKTRNVTLKKSYFDTDESLKFLNFCTKILTFNRYLYFPYSKNVVRKRL